MDKNGSHFWNQRIKSDSITHIFEKSSEKTFSKCRVVNYHSLHCANFKRHNLYSSSNINRQIKSRRMRWAGHVARMGRDSNGNKILVEKSEGKAPFGRQRRRWEDGIRMDLTGIGWGNVEWIQLPQVRDRWRALVNTVMNLRVLTPRS
jgi:hypothetical protein